MKNNAHRKPAQIARDRRRAAELYLKGYLQVEIAQELGLNQGTISRDLKAIQRKWEKDAVFDFNKAKQKELAKIDMLELEYWNAWQASKSDKKIAGLKRRANQIDGEQTVRTETQVGDPRFLSGVQWCIDKRCQILGFNAPTKIAPTDPSGEFPFSFVDLVRAANETK